MSETLQEVVAEYLYWRKMNPHIKGGENYLKRLHAAQHQTNECSLDNPCINCVSIYGYKKK